MVIIMACITHHLTFVIGYVIIKIEIFLIIPRISLFDNPAPMLLIY